MQLKGGFLSSRANDKKSSLIGNNRMGNFAECESVEAKKALLKITIDRDDFKLLVGGVAIDPMLTLPSRENYFDQKFLVIRGLGFDIPKEVRYVRDNYKPLHEFVLPHLGPSFNRRMSAISYRAFIEPLGGVEKYIRRNIGAYNFKYPLDKLRALYRARLEVEQAEADGMHTIIPLIIALEKNPSELKKLFGKSIWRTILKSSMAQNKRVAWLIDKCWHNHIPVESIEHFRSIVLIMLQSRAWHQEWWLRSGYDKENIHLLQWMGFNGRRRISARDNGGELIDSIRVPSDTCESFRVFRDACSMAKRLGLPLRIPKSFAATMRWHNELIRQNTMLITDSRKRFNSLKFDAASDTFSMDLEGGIEAVVKLLTSPFLIAKEGIDMRHCVASRIWDVETGISLVAHIKCGNDHATVEWEVGPPIRVHEISGFGNSAASDNCIAAARKAVEVLKLVFPPN